MEAIGSVVGDTGARHNPVTTRREEGVMRSTGRWMVLVAGLLLAACGGGGGQGQASDSAGNSGSGSTSGGGAGSGGGSAGSGGSGAPPGSTTGHCASIEVPAEALAGKAEGLWRGQMKSWNPGTGIDSIQIVGLTTWDGSAHFWLQGSRNTPDGTAAVIGRVGQAPDGTLLSSLDTLARPPGATGASRFIYYMGLLTMSLTAAEPRTRLMGGLVVRDMEIFGSRPLCQPMSLDYDPAYDQPVPLADSAGVYTTADQVGYTMTFTVDPSGSLNGSDTNGCVLNGALSVQDAAHNYLAAGIDVTGCAAVSGHLDGVAVPVRGADGLVSVLYLSVSRDDTAVSFAMQH